MSRWTSMLALFVSLLIVTVTALAAPSTVVLTVEGMT
jgi:hypothetical protein